MATTMNYHDFLDAKSQANAMHGFAPVWMPDFLFDFQAWLTEWAVRKGHAAIFADCGMGKTPMELVFAENAVRHDNRRALILAPLAVAAQTVREGEKFGVECRRANSPADLNGAGIYVTNYEKLHKFDPADFGCVVCDESSILKSFDGALRAEITQFMRKVPRRLLATATAAPNDYVELGTSSEALGYLGHVDMLNMFFVNDRNNSATKRMYGEAAEWRFKGHAEERFWRWVTSWARAARKPSDIGFNDGPFTLPPPVEHEHLIEVTEPPPGALFATPATNLREQRIEIKRTLTDRCEKAAALVAGTGRAAVVWCHLNPEGDTLEEMIPDAVQVSGRDGDEAKEEKFLAFSSGQARVLVCKPKIGAWGLNWQHCAHVVYFPSHSYEQKYQAVRRCWRYGQRERVTVDTVLTEGERRIQENVTRKEASAANMFTRLVECMNDSLSIKKPDNHTKTLEAPQWL